MLARRRVTFQQELPPGGSGANSLSKQSNRRVTLWQSRRRCCFAWQSLIEATEPVVALAAFLRKPETQHWIAGYGISQLDDQSLFFSIAK
jgi:hypothetical protein